MRNPYLYGYSPDVSFSPQSRPGRELWRGGCIDCGPEGLGPSGMAGVRAVPSGTYMGPIGKIVLSGGGMRGYGYSSGPGIPDMVSLPVSPTARAAEVMGSLGMANVAQTRLQGAGLRGMGLGSTQDRQLCQGFTQAAGGVASGIRDINRAEGEGGAAGRRDQGFDYAGQILGAMSQIGGALCNTIRTESATQITTQPPGTTMPPSYTQPGYTPPPPAASSGLPAWALPAGIVAAAVVIGAIALR